MKDDEILILIQYRIKQAECFVESDGEFWGKDMGHEGAL